MWHMGSGTLLFPLPCVSQSKSHSRAGVGTPPADGRSMHLLRETLYDPPRPVSPELCSAPPGTPYISRDGFSRALSSSLMCGCMGRETCVPPYALPVPSFVDEELRKWWHKLWYTAPSHQAQTAMPRQGSESSSHTQVLSACACPMLYPLPGAVGRDRYGPCSRTKLAAG